MAQKLEKITSRDTDFAKWYTDVVKNAKLMEYGQVKGTMILKPNGYAIWEMMQSILDKNFKDKGVKNVYFPLLIPESLFMKEKKHIEGFAPELATITMVGNKELSEKLFIRPTSEVLIADFLSNEIKSYRDLPIKYNQWVNVLRWEKTTRPFLRSSEFLWQEGHTFHSSSEEARNMTLDILEVYKSFVEDILLVPVLSGLKTDHEKFAGAKETYTIESIMYDGQALQSGTSHFFDNEFAKAFNIKFQNKEQKEEYAYSSSWGVSTRLIGALIMTHGDDNGMILPSKIAPIQISIIPVNNSESIIQQSESIFNELNDKYRIEIDFSDKTFGYKMSESEIQGIPLRIEVGPRDIADGNVVLSDRISNNKIKIKLTDLVNEVDKFFKDYDIQLKNRAIKNLETKLFSATTLEEYDSIIKNTPGFVLVPFCGEVSCEDEVKLKTSTVSRCIKDFNVQTNTKCFNCNSNAKMNTYFARSY
ncbi:proline--tRNA ligase [Spiroplasma turonicum]|uniref:Proline--tRNA ligase n=1 Tax=Spiroplasma turonicum TaxID=216946 RepID=A0A0K1P7C2_9MOLU|nr:proline--tRNA ligase [Spiroplasma turonicum]AKU80200.1 prolyl-tRNA synthetase [Spiroplasma turonicum]ALX71200.1 prolyl-tRNA synthetase [Spiroplasma turonicum]